jgi:hypothetical protein
MYGPFLAVSFCNNEIDFLGATEYHQVNQFEHCRDTTHDNV